MKHIFLDETKVKRIGRVFFDEDGKAYLGMSGCGIEFHFSGRYLEVKLQGDEKISKGWKINNFARVAIYINEKRVVDTMLDSPEKSFILLDEKTNNDICVRIIKLSEMAMSTAIIDKLVGDDSSDMRPIDQGGIKKPSIEFIGDSITCGYAIDDEDLSHVFTTATEDVTKAYAYRTAELLNADYSMFSASGHGIISGYTADPNVIYTGELIPPLYLSYGRSQDTFGVHGKPEDMAWDFSKDIHDAVVINLGTNDDSYCQDVEEKQEHFKKEYIEFLKVVREKNPKATIFCAMGLMGDRIYKAIEKACREYCEYSGDTKVYSVSLPGQDGSEGYVVDYHPVPVVHERAAVAMAAFIREKMGW